MLRVLALLGLCLGILAGGCVKSEPVPEPVQADEVLEEAGPPPEPGDVYVVLPVSYARHLEDARLLLASGGQAEDLPVYPSTAEAEAALRSFESVHERARNVWAVFRLGADWDRDVVPLAPGAYRLKAPARILNMVTDAPF